MVILVGYLWSNWLVSIIVAAIMSAIYEDNKDEDGFLYMSYSGENTFGIMMWVIMICSNPCEDTFPKINKQWEEVSMAGNEMCSSFYLLMRVA